MSIITENFNTVTLTEVFTYFDALREEFNVTTLSEIIFYVDGEFGMKEELSPHVSNAWFNTYDSQIPVETRVQNVLNQV